MNVPVVYEVNLEFSGDDAAAFDRWLDEHVEKMLAHQGFSGATISRPGKGDESLKSGLTHRTVQYRLDSQVSLENYLEHHAERMRADGAARFGDRLRASRRVLNPTHDSDRAANAAVARVCRNCKADLSGQYCAVCGQRDTHRMISLWELVRDFVGDIFDVDSRLWRSLWPLLFRPGFLTLEYLAGRRVQYTPPLRMYLVLSVLFFLVASVGTNIANDDSDRSELEKLQLPDEIIQEIEAEIEAARGAAPVPPEAAAALPANDEKLAGEPPASTDISLNLASCEIPTFPPGLALLNSPAVKKRFVDSCKRLQREGGGEAFVRGLVGNIPTMMFFFLPILALAMKFLYLGSRRYYVEHLLFIVHFHSFFYLAATVTVAFARLPEFFTGQGVVSGLMTAGLVLYSPFYLFRSMRRVYPQWWIVTAGKFVLLNVAYFLGLAVTFALTALITALTA